jgi:hypothetical protein
VQKRKLNEKRQPDNPGPQAFDKLARGSDRSPGGKEVIVDQYTLSRLKSVGVKFHGIGPVLECVFLADCRSGKFSGLSYRDKTGTKAVCEGRTKNKPARFDSNNLVDADIAIPIDKGVDSRTKSPWFV